MTNKKDKIICFSTTEVQYEELHQIASTKDSMSALLREIIREYLERKKQSP